jgi:lysophospholipase L1-like esterase
MKRVVWGIVGVVIVLVVRTAVFGGHHKTTTTVVVPRGSYVALGDSVAAGDGLEDASDSSACNRTDEAYPNLVASSLNFSLKSVACSGATLAAGILASQAVNDLQETPQVTQLFAQPKPKLITITIGANDTGWTSLLEKCYISTCGTAADSAAVQAELATVSTNLQTVLSDIKNQYGAQLPTVLVTGYYQVFPATATSCADLTGIDASEQAFGRTLQSSISTTIQKVVSANNFAQFVPIDFSGHELCTAQPWVQGLNASAPYHPNDAGQAVIAQQVVAAYKKAN